jgi:hypothetical protein
MCVTFRGGLIRGRWTRSPPPYRTLTVSSAGLRVSAGVIDAAFDVHWDNLLSVDVDRLGVPFVWRTAVWFRVRSDRGDRWDFAFVPLASSRLITELRQRGVLA